LAKTIGIAIDAAGVVSKIEAFERGFLDGYKKGEVISPRELL